MGSDEPSPFGRRNVDFELISRMVRTHAEWLQQMGIGDMSAEQRRALPHVIAAVTTWEEDRHDHERRSSDWRREWLPAAIGMGALVVNVVVAIVK